MTDVILDKGVNPMAGNPFASRADARQAVLDLVEPLLPHYRKQPERLLLGQTAPTYDEASEGLEAFIRPLWALVPFTAGGGEFAHWDLIRQGLIAGTDPDSPGYWGPVGITPGLNPATDQRMVEMAAFGVALAMVPEEFFDPLTEKQRQNVIEWLSPINVHDLRDNNWQFFRVLVNLGFDRVGGPADKAMTDAALATLESNYLGDGWYQDGASQLTTDFYIPFAFHFYSMIYAKLAGERNSELADTYRERAALFAPHWAARSDSEGRIIAYGRSMTYRFAGAGFWGALAYGDVEGLPWGQIRGHWARHMRWWSTQQVATGNGILSIGWAYNNLYLAESYNAPGSPYWALKAFLPLALPEDHPFWTAEEAEPDTSELKHVQAPANAVVNRKGSQSQLLTSSGQGVWFPRQGAAKYGKFAYSSAFPFALESDDPFNFAVAESTLAFVDMEGHPGKWARDTRRFNLRSGMEGDVIWAEWQGFDGVNVTSVWAGEGDAHSRIHLVQTERRISAVEGGFAIEYTYEPTRSDYVEHLDGASARVTNAVASSAIADPSGARTAVVRPMQPNASIQWRRSVAPMLESTLEPGAHVLRSVVRAAEERDVETPEFDDRLVETLARVAGVSADTLR